MLSGLNKLKQYKWTRYRKYGVVKGSDYLRCRATPHVDVRRRTQRTASGVKAPLVSSCISGVWLLISYRRFQPDNPFRLTFTYAAKTDDLSYFNLMTLLQPSRGYLWPLTSANGSHPIYFINRPYVTVMQSLNAPVASVGHLATKRMQQLKIERPHTQGRQLR